MQRPSIQTMSRTRTIFLQNGQPRYEDHSALMEVWFISVKLDLRGNVKSDVKLMDLVIAQLRAGRYMITHNYAPQDLEPYHVSFPVMNLDRTYLHGWYSTAIGTAEFYQEEIAAKRLAVDWDYLLEPR
ncbi:hypothetical protein N7475_008084 [Penicillium sp. IBT 31633x]|nr:hypothetical protein N7475_008084 [Penicillium sp. IBT 31633x]